MNTTVTVSPPLESSRGDTPDALSPFLRPEMFRALGDATRLTLLARLATTEGALRVTELSSCCGVHLSGVSRHLKILHDAGLIAAERQGREVLYRLDCQALAQTLRGMADALDECHALCCAPICSPHEPRSTSERKENHDSTSQDQ